MSRDIDRFYAGIPGVLKTAENYLGSNYLRKFIIACRLKPLYALLGRDAPNNRLETIWCDEWGASIHISHGKLDTYPIEPALYGKEIVSTDLFARLPRERMIKEAKAVVISESHLLFYGRDDYLRAIEPTGKHISPLTFGADALLTFMPYLKYREKLFGDSYALYALPNPEIERLLQGNNV